MPVYNAKMMNVIYLVHEDGMVKVPLYDYDAPLFSRLRFSKTGFWDAAGRQFVLQVPANGFESLFADRVFVELGGEVDFPQSL
jgi:hypothetical protein